MTTMIAEVYDALKDAGASEDKARKAAEAVAQYDTRLAGVEAKVTLLMWVVGLHVAVSLTGFGLVLSLLWQVLQRLPKT